MDVIASAAADKAFAEFDNLVLAFVDGADPDAVGRAAILLADDDVLGDVDEFAGHIPGVGGFESSIGETLAGAVSRDEILEHGEALAEVREHGFLDDFAAGLGHQAAETGELTNLLFVAARA